MDEIELIREQLAIERARLISVLNTCADALDGARRAAGDGTTIAAFVSAGREYLEGVLAAFAERDRRLVSLCAGLPESPERRALEQALAGAGDSAAALKMLATASTARREGWPELARYVSGAWSARREALDSWLAAHRRTRDWRAVAALDADSIVLERARFARLQSLRPAGLEVAPRAARSGSVVR